MFRLSKGFEVTNCDLMIRRNQIQSRRDAKFCVSTGRHFNHKNRKTISTTKTIMSTKYKNKYRIESTRLKHWDYGCNAAYFVTICTKNRVCYFGDVVIGYGSNMGVNNTTKRQDVETQDFASLRHVATHHTKLSKIGKIAHSCWQEIPNHFPFVKLGVFVVMPNHVHGIIIIDKSDKSRDAKSCVSKYCVSTNSPKNRFGPQSKNLASIIRGFKTGVTVNARQINPGFAWQPRFHDRIIRDKESYESISEYIVKNPVNWNSDRFNKR